MASSASVESSSSVWLVDSEYFNHITSNRRLFRKLDESQKMSVHLGDDKVMEVLGVGTVTISTKNGEFKQLHGVQLVPGITHKLLSVGQLLTKGYSVIFLGNGYIIRDDHIEVQILAIPRENNNMFPLDLAKIERLNLAINKIDMAELWHQCFGHLNCRSLESLTQRKMVSRLPELKQLSQCEDCTISMQARSVFQVGNSRRTTTCLQLVHMDICGPMSTTSLGANRYFLLLVDDFSRKCWVYVLKNKGEAFEQFWKFHVLVE